MRAVLIAGIALSVCNASESPSGKPSPPPAPDGGGSSVEWDRPMPFVDDGWFCGHEKTCVWSEDAVKEGKLLFVDKEHPPKAYCYSGVFTGDHDDFRRCTRTLEHCERFHKPGGSPCRAMTPTEFWEENPMLVETRRKICKPQECPPQHRWVGAAKIKEEELPIDDTAISELGDGILLVEPSSPKWPGVLLHEDRDCAYGCVLRKCTQEQQACVDTTSLCDLCLDEEEHVSAQQCRDFVERCREVTALEEAAVAVCVFADVSGDDTKPGAGCPVGYVCKRVYGADFVDGLRRRGICEQSEG